MLNVLITDIYNLAAKDAYQGLSFPLGSKMSIPLKFQNEHAHSFANNIEGIEVGIELKKRQEAPPSFVGVPFFMLL